MNRRQFVQLTTAAITTGTARAYQPAESYRERYRPQFHFSPKSGWTNDPNGLVLYKGKYHLFFQHNPFDVKWGNMTWGHATSNDMLRWTQLEHALHPDRMGTMFSGSAVVDWNNSAGFQQGDEKPIVLIYTAAGDTSPESKGQPFTQCIAYSTDAGRTFTKYTGNPVVPKIVGSNRDPKVVWHEQTRQWIMTLFLEGNTFAFLASPDLKRWELLHTISVPKCSECPDFFEMPVEDDPGASRWVWTSANGSYLVGSFDGKRFTPEVMTQSIHSGSNYYAAQTYSDLPGKRRVQLAWMSGGEYPGMPFNQQMSFPCELRLRRHGYKSFRLFPAPIREIESLRTSPRTWKDVTVRPGSDALGGLTGDTLEVDAEIETGTAREVGFRIAGRNVCFTAGERQGQGTIANGESRANLALRKGRFTLHILVDRASVEVFVNDGEVFIPCCFLPDGSRRVELVAIGGEAKAVSVSIHPLKSIWS